MATPPTVPLQGDTFRRENAHFANLKVRAQYTPGLTVRVAAGGYWLNDITYVEYTGGNSPALTAAATNAKWSMILLNSTGAIEVLDGTEAASPVFPSITAGRIPLAAVYMQTTTTVITNDMVFDTRPIFAVGANLSGASVGDITGLTSQLDLKSDLSFVSNQLANKADASGTNVAVFELNKNSTGVPGENAGVRVNRGAATDVEIRWNESASVWQFTDDGTVYRTLASAFTDTSALAASVAVLDTAVSALNTTTAANSSSIVVLSASGAANASTIVVLQASTAANASSIVVLQASTAANASAIVILESGVNHPVDLQGYVVGVTTTSTLLAVYTASRAYTMPTQNHIGAYAGTADADGVSLNIKHGGGASALSTASVVGTIAWSSAMTSGSVNLAASVDVAVGDVVAVQASVVAGSAATLADFAWNIQATS